MASFTITGNSTIAQSLLTGENGFISQNGTLINSSGDAIVGTGDNQLTVLGTLSTLGVNSSAYSFLGTNLDVSIGAHGHVSSGAHHAIGANIAGRFDFQNAGTLQAKQDGLFLLAGSFTSSTYTNVINSGVIQAGSSGMYVATSDVTEITNTGQILADIGVQTSISPSGIVLLVNSGEIIGDYSGYLGNYGDQSIYNTGLISGVVGAAVEFIGGTNLYDGRGGEVYGKIQGGIGIDTLYGGDGFEEMYGDLGNDFMHGGGGDDILYGGEDNDTMHGGDGDDGLLGGEGNDVMRGGDGSDVLIGDGGNDTMHGGDGNDEMYGIDGNDVMRGGDGNDEMYGDSGRDTVRGGVGADFLDGGDGVHDWLDYRGSTGAVTINLGTGQASGGDASGDEFVNFERIVGTSGDDRLTGDSGDNALRGDNGNDLLRGASGNDFITGGRGADTMLGSSGVDSLDYRSSSGGVTVNLTSQTASGGDAQGDIISGFENVYGSNADDVLTGSSAANLLFGGGGSDVFRFTSSLGGSNVDKITDFSSGTDTIELDDAIFSAIAQGPGTLQSGYFKANASGLATDANDRIIYDTNGGQLYYDADGNSAGQALQFAQLTGAPALAFSDFDVV